MADVVDAEREDIKWLYLRNCDIGTQNEEVEAWELWYTKGHRADQASTWHLVFDAAK